MGVSANVNSEKPFLLCTNTSRPSSLFPSFFPSFLLTYLPTCILPISYLHALSTVPAQREGRDNKIQLCYTLKGFSSFVHLTFQFSAVLDSNIFDTKSFWDETFSEPLSLPLEVSPGLREFSLRFEK